MSDTTRKDDAGFMECCECAAKPGTPYLCQACLNNRGTLHQQKAEIERLRAKLQRVLDWLRHESSGGLASEIEGVLEREGEG